MDSLHGLLAYLGIDTKGIPDGQVDTLETDSRKVTETSLFFALPGQQGNGWEYLAQVRQRGGQWAIVPDYIDVPSQDGLMTIPVSDPVDCLVRVLSHRFCHYPKHLVAVTGTNGKSSTSYFVAQLAAAVGSTSAIVGTFGIGCLNDLQPASVTTPDILSLHSITTHLVQGKGVDTLAIEASSHGLDQRRLEGLPIQTAIFTNLSRDHLDYHATMEEYAAAKEKLLNFPDLKRVVLNADDSWAASLIEKVSCPVYRYSTETDEVDFSATHIVPMKSGVSFRLKTPLFEKQVCLPLLGRFNIGNALAALASLWGEVSCHQGLVGALQNLKGAPGRMETIVRDGQPVVVVDYSHTSDAIASALSALADHVEGKVICIFGCGGDRDPGKRPLMMAAALAGADQVILTSDNPRSEDPMAILRDAKAGLSNVDELQASGRLIEEVDRRKAIFLAISQAAPDDTILIAGKGHETYQEIQGTKHHFSDFEEAEKAFDLLC